MLLKAGKPKSLTQLFCLSIGSESIAYAVRKADRDLDYHRLQHSQGSDFSQQEILNSLKNNHILKQSRSMAGVCVLQPSEYRLLLMDAPPIPQQEWNAAAPWLVKDLIDYPIEEAAIQLFPAPMTNSAKTKIYVAIMPQARLIAIRELFQAIKVPLKAIDIYELALLGLPSNQGGKEVNAYVYESLGHTKLMLCHHGLLYLIRSVANKPIADVETSQLAEEIKDSFGFYQRNVEASAIFAVKLLSLVDHAKSFAHELGQQLGSTVSTSSSEQGNQDPVISAAIARWLPYMSSNKAIWGLDHG